MKRNRHIRIITIKQTRAHEEVSKRQHNTMNRPKENNKFTGHEQTNENKKLPGGNENEKE